MKVSENTAPSATKQNELQATVRMHRNSKVNQAAALIDCTAELALFVQHELPPLPPALTEELTILERIDARTQDANIRALSWGRISG
jgi:hypothetical protein